MTNGEEDPREQAITEAIEALRDLRGRRGPPDRAEAGDETTSDPDQEPGSAVVEDTGDVGSKGAEQESTQGTLSTEDEEAPEDWETRLQTFKKVTRADVESDLSDFRQNVVDRVTDLRTQIVFWAIGIVAAGLFGVWQMGESWEDDIRESFQDFREDIRGQIDRMKQAGERRQDRIEELNARTDSLLDESR